MRFLRESAPPSRQKGLALMMVIFAFALASLLATAMLIFQERFFARSSITIQQGQAREFAIAAEELAQALVSRYLSDEQSNVDFSTKYKAVYQSAYVFPIDHGVIEVQIDDPQAFINVNDLISKDENIRRLTEKRLGHLLGMFENHELSVNKIKDWIDSDEETSGSDGGEDDLYLIKTPPYRTPNNPMAHISELRLLDGMTPELYDELSKLLSTLPPGSGKININTAPVKIIQVLGKELMDEGTAQAFVDERVDAYLEKEEEFWQKLDYPGIGENDRKHITTKSNFFRISSQIQFADRNSNLLSLVHMADDGKLSLMSRDFSKKDVITKDKIPIL